MLSIAVENKLAETKRKCILVSLCFHNGVVLDVKLIFNIKQEQWFNV